VHEERSERDSTYGAPLGVSGYDLFERERFRRPPFFAGGTLAPFFRASDNPIAIACARLFTLPPRPDFPLRRVPFLRRRMALSTLLLAPLLYFRRLVFREELFFVAMTDLSRCGD
jgi:hypothetical protein